MEEEGEKEMGGRGKSGGKRMLERRGRRKRIEGDGEEREWKSDTKTKREIR